VTNTVTTPLETNPALHRGLDDFHPYLRVAVDIDATRNYQELAGQLRQSARRTPHACTMGQEPIAF